MGCEVGLASYKLIEVHNRMWKISEATEASTNIRGSNSKKCIKLCETAQKRGLTNHIILETQVGFMEALSRKLQSTGALFAM